MTKSVPKPFIDTNKSLFEISEVQIKDECS